MRMDLSANFSSYRSIVVRMPSNEPHLRDQRKHSRLPIAGINGMEWPRMHRQRKKTGKKTRNENSVLVSRGSELTVGDISGCQLESSSSKEYDSET